MTQPSFSAKCPPAKPHNVTWRSRKYLTAEEVDRLILKGCTKTAFDPLRATSNLAAKASCARESLPQLILIALHPANLSQLLKDVPFFFVRKTLLERSLFVADTLGSRREAWR